MRVYLIHPYYIAFCVFCQADFWFFSKNGLIFPYLHEVRSGTLRFIVTYAYNAKNILTERGNSALLDLTLLYICGMMVI